VPPFAVALPEFVQRGAPLIVALALVLSWIAARMFLRTVPLTGNARRGLYLGLGAANGIALVGVLALFAGR
jgi:predicted tellurium resistance membrane protein TerC